MVGMIFAAGLGTRLKPLTDTMPKALVPLAGKPLLQWQVEKLRDAGITDIIVNVHHFPDMIIDTVRANNGWGCNITISDERDQLLDTGGGLKKILNEKLKIKNEPILACNVDILSNIDIREMVDRYASPTSLLVVSDRQTQRYLCFDETDRLCGWTNIKTGELKGRDGRHLAFSGMQILRPEVLALLPQMNQEKFSLIDFYLQVMHQAPLKAYIPQDYRMVDVGKIDQIEEAEAFAESL
ncbi:MAG: nucleotidyltransferase family protein [Paludibacteraceae bacterium]|nr:nucleotidyltransferase family protein [Paludibacteraceae bacterium]